MALAIATIGAPHVDEGLRAQGIEPVIVDWTPPAHGDLADVALLTRAYADDDVEAGNHQALALLDAARPHVVTAGAAADLVPGMHERVILQPGPPCEWEHMGPAMRSQVARAALFEGWTPDEDAVGDLIGRGEIVLAPAHAHGVAIPMCGVLSPSMAAWAVRDEATGAESWAPMSDGAGDGLGAGVPARHALARQRMLADRLAPGVAAALALIGPIDLAALALEARTMGDEPTVRPRAASLLLVAALLPGMASRALDAVPALAAITGASDRLALPLLAAAARVALQSATGPPRSSLLVGLSGNGTDVAVMLAGLPGTWFTAPAPIADDAEFTDEGSAADAAPWTGDQGIVACADLAIDARLCLDAGESPAIPIGIGSRVNGAWIGSGVARLPLAPIRDALNALVPPRS